MAKDRPYDMVEVRGPPSRKLTPQEFDQMPLDERVKLILAKQLRFLKGGKEVPAKDVLAGQ